MERKYSIMSNSVQTMFSIEFLLEPQCKLDWLGTKIQSFDIFMPSCYLLACHACGQLLRIKLPHKRKPRTHEYQEQKQKHTNSISVGDIKMFPIYMETGIHTCRYMFITACICLLLDRCRFHLYRHV